MWTDNENFSACGAGEPAAQARKLFRGEAREKKSVGFVDEGGKASRGAEVKYIDIVLFVVLISALYVHHQLPRKADRAPLPQRNEDDPHPAEVRIVSSLR